MGEIQIVSGTLDQNRGLVLYYGFWRIGLVFGVYISTDLSKDHVDMVEINTTNRLVKSRRLRSH